MCLCMLFFCSHEFTCFYIVLELQG
uniref:Uncharacterized protein n=1 Tax=Anguilla anguilla TaxID=7936 RepID=A0A0E9U9V6_ANGAN